MKKPNIKVGFEGNRQKITEISGDKSSEKAIEYHSKNKVFHLGIVFKNLFQLDEEISIFYFILYYCD